MARYAKRLAQTALSTTTAAVYTVPASTTAQVTEIYFANTGTTQRTINVTVGGTFSTNSVIIGLQVNGTASVIVQDTKIVAAASTIVAARQDSGTDIICTIFGIEEV
jgi:hypothetical protein